MIVCKHRRSLRDKSAGPRSFGIIDSYSYWTLGVGCWVLVTTRSKEEPVHRGRGFDDAAARFRLATEKVGYFPKLETQNSQNGNDLWFHTIIMF